MGNMHTTLCKGASGKGEYAHPYSVKRYWGKGQYLHRYYVKELWERANSHIHTVPGRNIHTYTLSHVKGKGVGVSIS